MVAALHAGRGAGLATALLAPVAASAHSPSAADAPLWLAQGLFALAWLAYGSGALRRRPSGPRQFAFHAVMLIAGLALFGPLDDWAASSTALHMVQHMLLLVVVAPLAVLAGPLPQWRAAFGGWADAFWRALLRLGRRPMACATLQAAALWVWHAPGPYMAALDHTGLHVLEHACFLFSGWLFWWSVLRPGRYGALQAALALLFTTMHTGLLGALLTFAPRPLYWRESTALWDQQLAGLVMWVPGGMVYLLAAGWALYRWLSGMERGDARSETSTPDATRDLPGPA
ncbi:MAG: cytochrome c oxidase assembly protein [Methylibium sp.]|uniref:cytochrome c oxidase assembly protein n=1 Tax=Methylibium sp. TaxID=2067992 RepID=UPI00184E48BF|nr:cytochrome c oxidase assembly protein [Methylibium sp.]MBA3597332.1 cytochrome c oxidase assembly protein [Methylibium sp.]